MSIDQFARVMLGVSEAAIVLAGAALVIALTLIALVCMPLARKPRVVLYDVAVPHGSAPAAELLFAQLHAVLRAHASAILRPRPPLALIAQGSAAGLKLRVVVEPRAARRVQAAFDSVWPGARLVSDAAGRTGPTVALEWRPLYVPPVRTSTLPGAATAMTRALTRTEVGEELSLDLSLLPGPVGAPSPLRDLLRRPEHTERARRRSADEAGATSSRQDVAFACRLAIGARAKSEARARALLGELEPSVRVLCVGSGIRLGAGRRRKSLEVRSWLAFDKACLTPSEVAVLFPLALIAAAAASRSAQTETEGERLLGLRTQTTTKREVRFSLAESRHHLHLLGPTGTGKSTLLLNLAAQDIAAGRGCAVLDPKGDLVRDLLVRIPRSRIGDVVYLGPNEGARAVGINPLALALDEDPNLAAENLLSIFKRIYEDNWGPRTDDVLKSCLLTLVVVPGSTLAHIPALLSDPALRRRLTAQVDDAIGLGGFWRWYDRLSEAKRLEATAPLLNKLRDFLVRPRLRHLLCQPRSSVDLRVLMDRGGILLGDLGTGRWGESASALAGSFLVARLWQAALSRQSLSEERRRDFLLYIDEFQSFLGIGGPFADALAQARGLRLSLTIANQHLGQLPHEIREAVAANARSRILFRCAAQEAAALAPEFAPLEPTALAALRPFEAAVRLRSTTSAFAIRTLPAAARPADAADAAEVLAASAARFGREVASIDTALRRVLGTDEGPEEPSQERSGR